MCAYWKKGYTPNLALTKLKAEKKVSNNGKVGFAGNYFEDCIALLGSSVVFSSSLPEDITRRIIAQSVFAAARANKFLGRWVLGEISRQEEEYRRKPINQYFMATSISIKSKTRLAQIRSSGYTIKFGDEVPKVIRQKEREYRSIFYQAEHTELPQDYTRVMITTTGRSISEAGWRALDNFDFCRAIWNLGLNLGHSWRISTGPTYPVNDIVCGPIQTLFHEDGTLIEDQWWYERGYRGPIRVKDVTRIWNDIRRYERKVLAKLRASPHKDFLAQALRRYVRALDGSDYESVFLKLWSLLEHLTYSTHDNYDVTIRRAAFLWQDYSFHREVLNHLRDSRNTAVHLDSFANDGEALIYQLKRYVEALLDFLIFKGVNFKTMEQLKHFLDLAPNKNTLMERQQLIRRGIKFLTG